MTIRPLNNNGSILLKFRLSGVTYRFNPVPKGKYGCPKAMAAAQMVATRIENDILSGTFDESLEKYRRVPKAAKPKPKKLIDLWDLWVASMDLDPSTEALHYHRYRQMILKADPGIQYTDWFTKLPYTAGTQRHRLGYLRSMGAWAVTQGYLKENIWLKVKPRKEVPREVKPFTQEEIKAILEGFRMMHPEYLGFTMFLLATGCRPSEAAAIQWQHIDGDRLTIKETFALDPVTKRRVRQHTKTANLRYLPLDGTLRAILGSLEVGLPEALVFTTLRGYPIHPGYYRARIWAPILVAVDVPYRKPYTTRHTMASHGIAQGLPLTDIAYLLGHKNTRMVMETYGHMIGQPKLPEVLPED